MNIETSLNKKQLNTIFGIAKHVMENGGATIKSDLTIANYTTGYGVGAGNISTTEYKNIKGLIIAIAYGYEEFIKENLPKQAHFGLWIDNGKLYIDKSMVIVEKGNAMEIAKQNNELAIWDFATNESIYL